MGLNVIFSCFATKKPSDDDIEECEDVLHLTPPGNWNPNSKVCTKNEANILDFEGNMIEEQHRIKVLLSEVPECGQLHDGQKLGQTIHGLHWINQYMP